MRIIVRQVPPAVGPVEMGRVAVVFPAYNEQDHVAEAVRRALDVGVAQMVAVNDCSTDATGEIIRELASSDGRIHAVHHEVNRGKQAAVRSGLRAILDLCEAPVIAVLDADMQDDPAHLPGLCGHVGSFDVAIGIRLRGPMPPIRRLANTLANLPYQLLAAVRIHDVQSGYRVYTRQVAAYLARRLSEKGRYTFEHTSMLLFGRMAAGLGRDFRIAEVPVPYSYEGARSGIRPRDNLQLTWASICHAARLAALRRRPPRRGRPEDRCPARSAR